MAHSVKLVEDEKYIVLFLIGDQTRSSLEIAREEASTILTENGLSRVLVDVTQGFNKMPVTDNFSFTIEHQENFPENTRHAMLVSPEQVDDFRFVENVSQNRGIPLKLFLDRDEAISWLVE